VNEAYKEFKQATEEKKDEKQQVEKEND